MKHFRSAFDSKGVGINFFQSIPPGEQPFHDIGLGKGATFYEDEDGTLEISDWIKDVKNRSKTASVMLMSEGDYSFVLSLVEGKGLVNVILQSGQNILPLTPKGGKLLSKGGTFDCDFSITKANQLHVNVKDETGLLKKTSVSYVVTLPARREVKEVDYIQKGKWQKGKKIGSGGFGTVYQGINMINSKLIAIKEMTIKSTEEIIAVKNEIKLLKFLKHPHIVQYLGVEQKSNTLYIFLDFIPGGSLKKVLKDFDFNEEMTRKYAKQLVMGLKYLHDNKVVHNDVKTDNVLVDDDGTCYLTDFGCSRLKKDLHQLDDYYVGTPYYMAPEVFTSQKYTSKSDVFSLGIIILEMMGTKAYHKKLNKLNPREFIVFMRKNIQKVELNLPKKCSSLMTNFLKAILTKDPEKRPECAELLEHPWFSEKGDLMQKGFGLTPEYKTFLNNRSPEKKEENGTGAIIREKDYRKKKMEKKNNESIEENEEGEGEEEEDKMEEILGKFL